MDPRSMGSNMNEELAKFINVFSNFDANAPLHPPLKDSACMANILELDAPWQQEPGNHLTGKAWANANAFMARVCTAVPDEPILDHWGLFAMIEALEQPLTPAQLEDVLPAAACWFIYKATRSNDIPYANYDTDGGSKRVPWSRGELWSGPHALGPARWEFWMKRFKEVSERSDVSDSVRQAALEAVEAGSQ